jgi:hypothetical protein
MVCRILALLSSFNQVFSPCCYEELFADIILPSTFVFCMYNHVVSGSIEPIQIALYKKMNIKESCTSSMHFLNCRKLFLNVFTSLPINNFPEKCNGSTV